MLNVNNFYKILEAISINGNNILQKVENKKIDISFKTKINDEKVGLTFCPVFEYFENLIYFELQEVISNYYNQLNLINYIFNNFRIKFISFFIMEILYNLNFKIIYKNIINISVKLNYYEITRN